MAGNGNNTGFLNLEQHRPEIEEQLNLELQNIREGKLADALLIEAMAYNWSVPWFLKVAGLRGKSWRFMAALADKALEIQGYGMLNLVTQVISDRLTLTTYERAGETLKQLHQLAEKFKDVPHADEMLEEAAEDIKETRRRVRNQFWDDIDKMRR